MRVLFLNQYFPPDPAPTGVLFREIADELVREGVEVDFVDAGEAYREGQGRGGRMRREVAALRRMLGAGKARPRADVVVSGTSPPCLAVVADRVARRHGARHIHWAMDVYPELAVALGEIRAGSLAARAARWLMTRAYRRCARVVALDADMAAHFQGMGIEAECIRPWVPASFCTDSEPVRPVGPWTWIYSGNLGRAHEFETLLLAQRKIEDAGAEVRLLFQGGGPRWQEAQARAMELKLKCCEFRGYAPVAELRASLLGCNAAVVTQRPGARGLLWPSKLAMLMTLPLPVAFVGPLDGAIAAELRQLQYTGTFAPGDATALSGWVMQLAGKPVNFTTPRISGATHRAEALGEWRRLILGDD